MFSQFSCNFWLRTVWFLLIAVAGSATVASPVPQGEQLTDADLLKIAQLLKQQDDNQGQASAPAETVVPSPSPSAFPAGFDLASILAQSAGQGQAESRAVPPSQEDMLQSLSLLSTLLSSNPQAAALMGQSLQQVVPVTTTTTTTTQNPLKDLDPQNAALLSALVASSGSNADKSKVAALLGLAAAVPSPTSVARPTPSPTPAPASSPSPTSAQNDMLAKLLASMQGQGSAGGIKQQDFQAFQNAASGITPASSNQLSSVLGLLGTLGSLSGGASRQQQPSLLENLLGTGQQQQSPSLFGSLLGGGQQQSSSSLLGNLLGGGAQQQQNGLLASLLSSPSQAAQRPSILQSIGTIASSVGSLINRNRPANDGKSAVRGVDTRLGLGYRFGENADAQVVWEIGPQLFTEPLSSGQKAQAQYAAAASAAVPAKVSASAQNPNRRVLHVIHHNAPAPAPAPRPQPTRATMTRVRSTAASLGVPSSTKMSRRLPPVPAKLVNAPPPMAPTFGPVHTTAARPIRRKPVLKQRVVQGQIKPSPTTKTFVRRNFYETPVPSSIAPNSQLTPYEQWLIQQQGTGRLGAMPQNNAELAAYENRREGFVFSKDPANKVVRVKAHPQALRRTPPSRQPPQSGRSNPGQWPYMNSIFQQRTQYINHAAEDSYAKRNAVGRSPFLTEYEREREREALYSSRRYSEADLQNPNRRTAFDTLNQWSEKSSVGEFVQNYVLGAVQSSGNNWVKNFFGAPTAAIEKVAPKAPSLAPIPSVLTAVPTQAQPAHSVPNTPVQSTAASLQTPISVKPNSGNNPAPNPSPSAFSLPAVINKLRPRRPRPKRPVIKLGDQVSYDDFQDMLHGGNGGFKTTQKTIPELKDASEILAEAEKFFTPSPEIFIDIANGEVSMRKAFGTMETFEPTPPVPLPEDHPKYVFNILKEQLAKEYKRIKAEQLVEAAKQRRREQIANGLSNPHDPIFMVAKDFELVEKES